MFSWTRVAILFVVAIWSLGQVSYSQEATADTRKPAAGTRVAANTRVSAPDKPIGDANVPSAEAQMSVEQIGALLDAIDPYLPEQEDIAAEIDIFGSTSMDALAHGWAVGFEKFHPQSNIVVSAKGSETALRSLAEYPTSIGMFSRPVTDDELAQLKQAGLKEPVAINVAREALAVYVNDKNPVEDITYPQLAALFCAEDPSAEVHWDAIGVTGPLAEKSVHVLGRKKGSGTRKFIEKYLFTSQTMHEDEAYFESNAELISAIEKDPLAIGIGSLKCGSHGARSLKLRHEGGIIESTDRNVLLGRYPLTRPLTLVLDIGQTGDKAAASREFVRYALSQAGQMQAIFVGFFPFDPPTLRAEMAKLSQPE